MINNNIVHRVDELIEKDKMHPGDLERESLFFIISSNQELWSLQDEIYDFKDHSIKPEILDTGICTSSKTLIRVAFNLFNSYPTDSLLDIFSSLDTNNSNIVIQALKIRLNLG